jgi:hypothetical protein
MARQKSYYELLKHPKWQKKRLEIMEEYSFTCEYCGAEDKTLQIHHTYYEKGLMPWEYPNESLHCLCEDCHRNAQDWMTLLHRQIGQVGLSEVEDLLGYALALETRNCPLVTIEVHSYAVASGVADAYHLTPEEVIDALTEGRIDGYKLDAMKNLKHRRGGWKCGICGVLADALYLSQESNHRNPYDALMEHAIEHHGMDRQAIEASYLIGTRDRRTVDGQAWMIRED